MTHAQNATIAVGPDADTTLADTAASIGERRPGSSGSARRWWVLGVIAIGQLMVVLDATVVNIALPSAQHALGFSDTNRQWIVTAYALAFGSLLLLGGRLADLVGRKPTFLVGAAGFAIASAIGGASTGFAMLVTARALQGVFGALLTPAGLALLTTTFTEAKQRAKAFSVYGGIAGAGGAMGLLLGGALTQYLSWRWSLYVNLILAGIALLGGSLLLRHQASPERPRLDLSGTVAGSAGLFCVVFGFSAAPTHGWSSPLCWGLLAGGAALLVVFVAIQARTGHPLLPLRILLDRNRGASYLVILLSSIGMFAMFLFLTYYLQASLGYRPVTTGLAFLPMIGAMLVSTVLSTNVLLPRVGPKPIVPLGMGIAAGGMVWLTNLGLHSGYAGAVLPPLLLAGFGMGLMMAPAMSLATYHVAPEDAGIASATVNTMQQVGGSIGLALLNTLAARATTGYLSGHRPTTRLLAHAQLHGYATAYWAAAGFFALGLLLSAGLYRRGRFGHDTHPGAAQQPATGTPDTPDAAPFDAALFDTLAPDHTDASPYDVNNDAATGHHTTGDHHHANGLLVRGTVVGAGRAPLADAILTLTDTTGRQVAHTRSAPEGDYHLPVPGSGTYLLIASATGRPPHASMLTVTDHPVDHDVPLAGAGVVTGTIRAHHTARSLPHASIIICDDRGEVIASVTSDAHGRYQLRDLAVGHYTLVTTAPGYQPAATPLALTDPHPVRHDVALLGGAHLRGTIRAARDNRPLADATVTLTDPTNPDHVIATTTTTPDGRYAFTDLPHGDYTLIAAGLPPTTRRLHLDTSNEDRIQDITLGHTLDHDR